MNQTWKNGKKKTSFMPDLGPCWPKFGLHMFFFSSVLSLLDIHFSSYPYTQFQGKQIKQT